MDRRIKITLSDAEMAQLAGIAAEAREPKARVAARMICSRIDALQAEVHAAHSAPRSARDADDEDLDANLPSWLQPVYDPLEWREETWIAVCALYRRYPRALAHLKDGWWKDDAHVEMLAAMAAWRASIDAFGRDPREELTFHAQLADYGAVLRSEGGGVSTAWKPDQEPPDGWWQH